jgi:deoxyribose-phosphate aldolase
MIDHSLLHPTMTDSDVWTGLQISKKYSVATACVKPYHILFAKKALFGTPVLVCPVIGFPHGNSAIGVKVFEAQRALEDGGDEIDMVVNIGRVLSGKWEYVEHEIRCVNEAVTEGGAILKVIFENDCMSLLLPPSHIILYQKIRYLWTKNRSRRKRNHQALRNLLRYRRSIRQDIHRVWIR